MLETSGRERIKSTDMVRETMAVMSERDRRVSAASSEIGRRIVDDEPARAHNRGAAVLAVVPDPIPHEAPPEFDTGPKPEAVQAA